MYCIFNMIFKHVTFKHVYVLINNIFFKCFFQVTKKSLQINIYIEIAIEDFEDIKLIQDHPQRIRSIN